MKRENTSEFTPAPVVGRRHVKERFPQVFRALHADLCAYPGGMSGLAVQLDKNPVVFCNKFNPNYRDATPTIEDVLESIEQGGARRGATALALLAGLVAVDLPLADAAPTAVVPAFLALIKQCGELMSEVAQDIADGRLDADERERCGAQLDALLPVVVQMRALVRS
jgi:hypothetical protein